MDLALLEHLARLPALAPEHEWRAWRIRALASGNNRLYRVTRANADWVVKFTIRDERQRAAREFAALSLLARLDAPLGPRPLHLDPAGYAQAVVVETWLEGAVLWTPPSDDATWRQVLRAYQRVHQVTPEQAARCGVALAETGAPLAFADTVAAITRFADQLPPAAHSEALQELLAALAAQHAPPQRSVLRLCHGDPNIRNVIATDAGVQLVDWEYSGLHDPADEIAKLMSHPLAATANAARWPWLAEQYADLSGEPDMLARIQVRYALRLAWWTVRLLFGRHVLLQRPSARLVGHAPEEEISSPENIALYFARARAQLAHLVAWNA